MKKQSDTLVCKKCKRPLPEGYKHKCCEACRNKQAEGVKNGLKVAGGVVATVGCVAISVLTAGKINPKK